MTWKPWLDGSCGEVIHWQLSYSISLLFYIYIYISERFKNVEVFHPLFHSYVLQLKGPFGCPISHHSLHLRAMMDPKRSDSIERTWFELFSKHWIEVVLAASSQQRWNPLQRALASWKSTGSTDSSDSSCSLSVFSMVYVFGIVL